MIGYLVEKNQIVKTFPTQVMGYPTIKFFSPGTPAGNMGEERASRDKSVPAIKVPFKVEFTVSTGVWSILKTMF